MARAETQAKVIELHGPPDLLEGLALVRAPSELPAFRVELPYADIAPVLLGQLERAGENATFLRLVLPEDTAPGLYEGTVQLGDVEHPVRLEVEGEAQLRFGRSSFSLEGSVGAAIPFKVVVANAGNVPVTIGRADAVGLFETGAIERRIHDGLRDPKAEGAGRLSRILDGLAESDGGLARLAIKRGSGKLAVGDSKSLEVELRPDQAATAGVTYEGIWLLHGAQLALRVRMTEGKDLR